MSKIAYTCHFTFLLLQECIIQTSTDTSLPDHMKNLIFKGNNKDVTHLTPDLGKEATAPKIH